MPKKEEATAYVGPSKKEILEAISKEVKGKCLENVRKELAKL